MTRFIDRFRSPVAVQPPSIQPTASRTVAQYKGRHGNADLSVREERTVRRTAHRDYDEVEIREVREARARIWHTRKP